MKMEHLMVFNQEINQKKLNLSHIYNLRNPEPYYQFITQYKYDLPERAKSYFLKVINTYRHYESLRDLKILDIGCSYGINAALLKFKKSIPEIYQHYTDDSLDIKPAELSRRHLDSKWFHESSSDEGLQFIGLDSAENAVNYAVEAQLLQKGISTNLEKLPLSPEDSASLQDINLLISTGCIGYITEVTFDKILAAVRGINQLWGAVFVLKMFDLSEIQKTLAKYNLVLVETGVTVKQRSFSSVDEKESMINFIEKHGLSAEEEKKSDNLFAQLFLILPTSVTKNKSIENLINDLRNLPNSY
jgi:SAM-dependent methyltransferase